jgi:predicted flap endonuclease-1-like 5' DNA nuclease
MGQVIIENEKGVQKTVSQQSWRLMRSAGQKDDNVRKGYRLVGPAGSKKDPKPSPTQPTAPSVPFHPESVLLAAKAAMEENRAKESAMISAEPQKQPVASPAPPKPELVEPIAPVVEIPAPVEVPPPAPVATPAPTTVEAPVKSDPLETIEGVGAKAAEILRSIGINTYAQLAAAQTADINIALDKGGFGPKKALVPKWKMKAKELSK